MFYLILIITNSLQKGLTLVATTLVMDSEAVVGTILQEVPPD